MSSVYVAATEGASGKSTVALGIVNALSRVKPRVGVFRPIARTTTEVDFVLELLRGHDGVIDMPYADCIGASYEQVMADPERALADIVGRYREVEKRCDVVVIIGSDYNDVAAPIELSFNARVATNLSAPVLLVLSGRERTPADVSRQAGLARARAARPPWRRAHHPRRPRAHQRPRRGTRPRPRRRDADRPGHQRPARPVRRAVREAPRAQGVTID